MNPSQLVTTSETIDPIFIFIFAVSAVMLVGITVVMVVFILRYHHRRAPEPTSQLDHHLGLELLWTIIPTLLVLAMFWYGWSGYLSLRTVPDNALPVTATARMWSWRFDYANGKSADKLYVPVGEPVRVELVAKDVLHAFYIPAFRVKRDMVPGMTTEVWFVADTAGSYDLFCAEYCGVGHAAMITTVEALPPEEFAAWIESTARDSATPKGRELLEEYGCLGCHSLDGSDSAGPTLKGMAESEVVLATPQGERRQPRDAAYLRRAILEPEVELVQGYDPIMPAFAGSLSEEDLTTMIDFLLQQGDEVVAPALSPVAQRGMATFEEQGCSGCHSLDGSDGIAPTLKSLFGQSIEVKRDGNVFNLNADAAYLRRAIAQPEVEIKVGYEPVMPAYAHLSEEEMIALLTLLRELR